MSAVTQRVRLQAISLAIVLAILDQTHGFTLRYEYVRPRDLTAEESGASEVRHELKRDIADDDDEYHVAPIAIAMPLIMTTENTIDNKGMMKEETISDYKLETTVIPNETNATHTEEITGSSSNIEEVRVPIQDPARVYNTTSTSITQEETTKFFTSPGVTDNYVDESGNVAINTKDLENTIFSKHYNATTETPNNGTTLTEHTNSVDFTTETSTGSVETTPTWKKYINIERKTVNISEKTVLPLNPERVRDSVNAHTTETRVSLEKAFDLAPDILSLQELKGHLMVTTNSIPTTDLLNIADTPKGAIQSIENGTKEESKTTEINPTEMVSMRAGYLDHTKPLINSVITTTANASLAGNEIEIEGVNAPYEMDSHDENEDIQNMTSHSQMVEDARKEEFLKEARLDVYLPYYTTKKNHKVNDELNEITPSPSGHVDQIANQQTAEDLTVRPISNDKKNNLYTVSPNYKPLKKIEVQPSKPFMRDPDDNSWRNESLSSLGIVFKGKNSSKAFTEVLKNKTETVMSNLPETEKVLEKVELRDRLEKIAEKRKSRKKKIDKFGNTEYGDYEENSSGDMHSSKEKSSGALDISLTTSTHPTTTKESATKGTVTEIPVKPKTRKPNHDYGGKDDYADYMTLPNIDILKSTPRPRVQWPVTQKMLDNTQPTTRQYFPDRQPTVQYFPPRPKATVSANNQRNKDYKFPFYGYVSPQYEPIENRTEKNRETSLTDKYVTDGRNRAPIENIVTDGRNRAPIENIPPAVQHVEYRPVGVTDGGSFSIRHYKDFLESVIKDTDYDKNGPYGPTSEIPGHGKPVKSEEYDYGQRKEGVNSFVDLVNQNHERFKADFPVLFNTSIVHGSESGKVLASSSAMFKRLYNGAQASQREAFSFSNKPYDPNCDNITVELSPAYELHYFVPEQEEMDEHTLPYGYRA